MFSLVIQLASAGEEVLLFYNDRASFETLIELMRSERHRTDDRSPLQYHINLVQLLALCTEGKNVYTEIKCHSLLPLDDIVRVVTHRDCIPEVCVFGKCACVCVKEYDFVFWGDVYVREQACVFVCVCCCVWEMCI